MDAGRFVISRAHARARRRTLAAPLEENEAGRLPLTLRQWLIVVAVCAVSAWLLIGGTIVVLVVVWHAILHWAHEADPLR